MATITLSTINLNTGKSIGDDIETISGFTLLPGEDSAQGTIIHTAGIKEDGSYRRMATVKCGMAIERARITSLARTGDGFAVIEILDNLLDAPKHRGTAYVETAYESPISAIYHASLSKQNDVIGTVRKINTRDDLYQSILNMFKNDDRFFVTKVPNGAGDIASMVKYSINLKETRAYVGELFSFGESVTQNSISLIGHTRDELLEYFRLFQ